MNIQKTIAAVFLLTASAVASAGPIATSANSEPHKTRAEVIAQLQEAYDQGLLPLNDADLSGDHRFSIRKTASDTKVGTSVKTY